MNKHFKRVIALLTLILTLAVLAACNNDAEDPGSKAPESFTPSDNMTELVVVTNSFCFDADYEEALNCFNQKLKDLGKDYYISFEVINNLPDDENNSKSLLTSYSEKYQAAVAQMKKDNKQADVLTMANIDDSSGYSDCDFFYLNDLISPLDDYLSEEKYRSIKEVISEKEWELASRDGKTVIVPTSALSATGRGWEVDSATIKNLGISETDLQHDIWEILENDELKDIKIYSDAMAENYQSGSGDPLPPYNAQAYYDLISSCVGVKLDGGEAEAVNIFEDEYMEKSMSAAYKLSGIEDSDLSLYPTTVVNSKITKIGDNTYIPIDGNTYLSGDLCGLGVASWSENKEYAFDLITELNTNKELALLLNYGIEGENYTLGSDDSVSVSDSQFEKYKNPYYIFSNRNILPADDSIIASEDLGSSRLSPICGFIFDNSNVKAEIESTNKVLVKYRETLFKGQGDYETLRSEFLNELEIAGVEAIVDEANRQISAWKEA